MDRDDNNFLIGVGLVLIVLWVIFRACY